MWIKRLFDILCSLLALILFSPLIIIVAILIKLTSRGPVLDRSKRIGQNRRKTDRRKENLSVLDNMRNSESRILDLEGRPFYMLEFRTGNTDRLRELVTDNNLRMTTKLGAFLQKNRVDKIPCLINVIKADMSIVGPRPKTPESFSKYGGSETKILRIKPGIIGAVQSKPFEKESLKTIHDKPSLEKAYIENWSLGSDFKIIGRTIMKVFHIRSS